MTDDELDRLRAMCEPDQQTWDLSSKDEGAIGAAVAELARLRDRVDQLMIQRDEARELLEEWLMKFGRTVRVMCDGDLDVRTRTLLGTRGRREGGD